MMRKLSPSKKQCLKGTVFLCVRHTRPAAPIAASYFIVLNSRPQRIAAIQLIGLYQTTLSSCE